MPAPSVSCAPSPMSSVPSSTQQTFNFQSPSLVSSSSNKNIHPLAVSTPLLKTNAGIKERRENNAVTFHNVPKENQSLAVDNNKSSIQQSEATSHNVEQSVGVKLRESNSSHVHVCSS